MPDENLYQEEEINLFDYIRTICKYKRIIAAIVLISLCLTVVYMKLQPAEFKATATFFPLNVKQYKSSNEEPTELKAKLVLEDLIISILKSRGMADKIINDLDLKNVWNEELLMDTRKALKNSTDIYLAKGGIVNIDIITNNGELSAKIANAYVDNLNSFNRKLQLSTDISLVQVIDRAVIPEKKLDSEILKKSIFVGFISLFFAVFLPFIFESIQDDRSKNKFITIKQMEKAEEFQNIEKLQAVSESHAGIYLGEELKKKLVRR